MAQTGKTLLMLLGMMGGLSAILFGFIISIFSLISSVSVHIPRQWIEGRLIDPLNGGFLYIMLGIAGIIGTALLFGKYQRASATLLLATGFLGFAVSYACSSGLMGILTWIAPGALLILAGILAIMTPERLGHLLPLLNSDRQPVRRFGYAVYGVLLLLLLAILFIIGMISLGMMLNYSASDSEANSKDALTVEADKFLTYAGIEESMGLFNESLIDYENAVRAYDEAIAKDPTNENARENRSYALNKLRRYNRSMILDDNITDIKRITSSEEILKSDLRANS